VATEGEQRKKGPAISPPASGTKRGQKANIKENLLPERSSLKIKKSVTGGNTESATKR